MPHTSVVFTHPTTPTSSPAVRTRILLKQYWTDASWTELEDARFDFCVWAVAPSMPRAQFSKRFGERVAPGDADYQTVARQTPADILGRYVKIVHEYYETATSTWMQHWVWYGIVEIIGSTTDGPVDAGTPKDLGDQSFMAYGLERLLEQHRITQSKWRDPVGSPKTADVGFTFNDKSHGNRSSGRYGTKYEFGYHPDPIGVKWSTQDIIEYLVNAKVGVPLDEAGNQDVLFVISSSDVELLPDWDAPEVETHGVSMKQIMDVLASRRRLYTWWLEVDETPAGPLVYIKIGTFTDADITLTELSGVIPANPNTVDIDVRFDATAAQVEQEDISHAVDQVFAYGAKRTTTTTVDFGRTGFATFVPAWTADQELDYETVDNTNADYPPFYEIAERRKWHRTHRMKETLRDVFRRWSLNDMLAYPPDDPDSYESFFDNVKLLPKLIFQEGVDYSGNKIYINDIEWLENEHIQRDPLLLIQVPRSSPAKYLDLSSLGTAASIEVSNEYDVRDWSASVRVARDGKSIQIAIQNAPQYTIAWADFNPRAEDEVEHGEWDWSTMHATVSFEDERYAQGIYPAAGSVSTTSAVRNMRIHAGSEYRQDYVAVNTVVGIDGEGAMVKTTKDGYIKDDTDKLTDIAEMAFKWYSKTRRAVRIRRSWIPVFDNAGDPLELSDGNDVALSSGEDLDLSTSGVTVQEVGLGSYLTALSRQTTNDYAVGSIISQISAEAIHDFADEPRRELPPIKMTINTAFGELDFVRLKLEV